MGYPFSPEKYQIPEATRKSGEHVRLVLALELPHLASTPPSQPRPPPHKSKPVEAMQKTMAEFGLMVCVETTLNPESSAKEESVYRRCRF